MLDAWPLFDLCIQAVVGVGLNLNLNFSSNSWNENNDVISDGRPALNFVDFDREPNKVSVCSMTKMALSNNR